MIRAAALTGAAAWTAPIIIDSLASPAAAQTCGGITFVGASATASTAGSPNTTITPVLPGGVQAGDLLIATISVTGPNSDSIA